MSKVHVVKQDEHLSGIALQHGFANFRIILDHPNNSQLKARRDPHVLLPGDKVFIPDRQEKTERGVTTRVHEFELDDQPLFLRLKLLDYGEDGISKAPVLFRLEFQEEPDTRPTDAKGIVLHEIEPQAKNGEITVTHTLPPLEKPPKKDTPPRTEELKFDLKIGRLDPENTYSGQAARLNNLGYFAGFTFDDIEQMTWATEEFECDQMGKKPVKKRPEILPEVLDDEGNPTEGTGIQDAQIFKKIKDLHGI